ncbi:MAG: hypothetical protein ABEJ02_02495 [Candidatus Paceibacteria bacterium]
MTTKKRIIYTILFIVAVLAIGYAIYWVFFAPAEPAPQPTPDQQPKEAEEQQLPTAQETEPSARREQEEEEQTQPEAEAPTPTEPEEKRVTQEVTSEVDHLDLVEEGARFYNEEDGRFYKLVDGELKPLDDKVFFNVESTAWAPNEDKAIIEYPDGANIYYNFETKEQETLPKHWTDFSFSNTGDKIAAKNMGFSPENRWLIEANPDGSSIKRIENMGDNADKVDVSWSPNGEVVALSRTGPGRGADKQEVYLVGENDENLRSLMVPGRAMQSKWSPSGEKILYSVYNTQNNYKPELWVVTANPGSIGQNRTKLNVDTWADKCAFANDTFIYCGVPTQLPKGAGFEPAAADDIEDDIYKINLQTGAQTQISTGGQSFTVESIQVDQENNELLITAKNQSGLFKIDI